MPALRFVHAARTLVDHQLHGLGPVDARLDDILVNATRVAFERLVEICLARDVDLLILAGDTIDCRDAGLRGPATVARELARLAERGISTVMMAGQHDAWGDWPRGVQLPETVCRLDAQHRRDTDVNRDGKLLAHVCLEGPPEPSSEGATRWLLRMPDTGPQPATICLHYGRFCDAPPHAMQGQAGVPAGGAVSQNTIYHAMGGASCQRTLSFGPHIMHDPGPTQAVYPSETGPRGCTLVEIDHQGEVARTFLATAGVRFEQLSLSAAAEMSRDDLLDEMQKGVASLERTEADQAWLLRWNIYGSGPLYDSLVDAAAREALARDLDARLEAADLLIHTHAVRLYGAWGGNAATAATDSLVAEFAARFEALGPLARTSLSQCLGASALAGGPFEAVVETLLAELDGGEVAHDALRAGMRWFAAPEELSS